MKKNNIISISEPLKTIRSNQKESNTTSRHYQISTNRLFLAPRNENATEKEILRCSSVDGLGDGPNIIKNEILLLGEVNESKRKQNKVANSNENQTNQVDSDNTCKSSRRKKLIEWLHSSQAKRDENNQQMFQRWINNTESESAVFFGSLPKIDTSNPFANLFWINRNFSATLSGLTNSQIGSSKPPYTLEYTNSGYSLQPKFSVPSNLTFQPVSYTGLSQTHDLFDAPLSAAGCNFNGNNNCNEHKIISSGDSVENQVQLDQQCQIILDKKALNHAGFSGSKFVRPQERIQYQPIFYSVCPDNYASQHVKTICPSYQNVILNNGRQCYFISPALVPQCNPILLQSGNAYGVSSINTFGNGNLKTEWLDTSNSMKYMANSTPSPLPQIYQFQHPCKAEGNLEISNSYTNVVGGLHYIPLPYSPYSHVNPSFNHYLQQVYKSPTSVLLSTPRDIETSSVTKITES